MKQIFIITALLLIPLFKINAGNQKMNNFGLPIANDKSDQKLLSDIKTHGWHVVYIKAEKDSPAYCFTVGVYYSYDHPEIVIMGLPQETSMALLHDLVNEIQKGKKFKDGTIDKNLASMSIGFKTVDKSHYDEYLGYGKWFYKSLKTEFPTVQYIWPDKEKKFPWKNGYNESYFQLQKKLYEKR